MRRRKLALGYLQRLETWMKRYRRDALASMNPGLNQEDLTSFEEQLGLELPQTVRAYFSWRDGLESGAFECLPPDGWEFLPSYVIETMKRRMDRGKLPAGTSDEIQTFPWWRPGFIPFLQHATGAFMCLDSAGAVVPEPWALVEYRPGQSDLTVRHEAFEHWLATVVETLEAGHFERDSSTGSFRIRDEAAYQSICKRLNPGCPVMTPIQPG